MTFSLGPRSWPGRRTSLPPKSLAGRPLRTHMHGMVASPRSERRALQLMLAATLILVLAVLRPLGTALFLAAVLAMVLWPIYRWLSARLAGHGALAAGLLVGLVLAVLVGPLVGLSAFVVAETVGAVQFVSKTVRSEGTHGLIAQLPDSLERQVHRLIDRVQVDTGALVSSLQEQLAQAGGSAAAALGAALSATGSLLFQTTMMLLALFFFLTNKEGVINWLDAASPLRPGQTRELFAEFVRVCKSVIVSTAATALVQSAAAVLGYWIAGVPYPFFFFALTFFVAFIPAAGAAAVCIAAALLPLMMGHPWKALFLAVYGIVVVGLIDNVVKPLLMKEGGQMHGAVVFFALIGGLSAFGAMGLLIGPLAVALFLAMLRMYHRDYSPHARELEPAPGVAPALAVAPASAARVDPVETARAGGAPRTTP